MMTAVPPPFERFYVDHRQAVLACLRRLLGPSDAEDAFQETFLRALRAYDGLAHAANLRAWVLTIATRVALDEHRRRPPVPVAEIEATAPAEEPPAYEQLAELAGSLPPTERAAVVLRYGYDLAYDDIGAALGSSAEAARQAASAGVRRLRKDLR